VKALILCAGYGTRLGSLTRETPKPLLEVAGRPLLEYLIQHAAAHGFNQIALNLHFRDDLFRHHFGSGAAWGVQLHYAFEPVLLGTAGAVRNLSPFLHSPEPFLVQYGDVLTDQDLTALVRFHREKQALATLLLHQRPHSNSAVAIDPHGRIVGFLERPTDQQRQDFPATPWANSGLAVFAPEFLEVLPTHVPSDLPRDVFPGLVPTRRLYGFPLTGYRCAVDSPERLEQLRAAVRQGQVRIACTPPS